jgi:hypothetical protein
VLKYFSRRWGKERNPEELPTFQLKAPTVIGRIKTTAGHGFREV